MKVELKPGKYIVAVSGGVDSMVLLNLLSKLSGLELVVAHFDHGIRSDSAEDRKLVELSAKKYGLRFVYGEGKLGQKASEAMARDARYKFLHSVAQKVKADAIITAHHQDDVLETAIINLLRGTGRKGLTSLQSRNDVIRPLLSYPKSEIREYAKNHKLQWCEDSTNQDEKYLRNYVRLNILAKFSEAQREELLKHVDKLKDLNKDIDQIVRASVNGKQLDRQFIIGLEHKVALDVMADWLRSNKVRDFDRKRLELLVRAAKTYSKGKRIDIDKKYQMRVNGDKLALISVER